jgi:type II secretory pathway pseudopilin PulG
MTRQRTSRPGRSRRGAFTLVEVLATLTLACIVLPVVVHGIVLCLETAAHTSSQAEATALAQSKMAELVAQGEWYDTELEGDFGEDWPAYRWLAQIGEWEDSRLSQLDVCVMWNRHGKDYSVVLSTLVYTGTANE